MSVPPVPANADDDAAVARLFGTLREAASELGRMPPDPGTALDLVRGAGDPFMSRAEAFLLASIVTQYVARGSFSLSDASADSARLGADAFDRVRGYGLLRDLVRKGLVGSVPGRDGRPPSHVATEGGANALVLHAMLAVQLDAARRGRAGGGTVPGP